MGKWSFWEVEVTNKVNIFTKVHYDFMPPSIKTSVKTTLGPIFGDISVVPSCMKTQESDISENCSTEHKTENAISQSRDRIKPKFESCKGFAETIKMTRSDLHSEFS